VQEGSALTFRAVRRRACLSAGATFTSCAHGVSPLPSTHGQAGSIQCASLHCEHTSRCSALPPDLLGNQNPPWPGHLRQTGSVPRAHSSTRASPAAAARAALVCSPDFSVGVGCMQCALALVECVCVHAWHRPGWLCSSLVGRCRQPGVAAGCSPTSLWSGVAARCCSRGRLRAGGSRYSCLVGVGTHSFYARCLEHTHACLCGPLCTPSAYPPYTTASLCLSEVMHPSAVLCARSCVRVVVRLRHSRQCLRACALTSALVAGARTCAARVLFPKSAMFRDHAALCSLERPELPHPARLAPSPPLADHRVLRCHTHRSLVLSC
jgi:hypothetical protein